MKKGTETKKLSALYRIGSSKRVLKSQWKTEGVPFYRGREVTRLAIDGFVDNELFISEEHFAELSKEYGVPEAGDIVITAIGTIGNSHVVRSSDRFYFKDASVLWMKRTADVSSEFINLWLKSPLFFDQLDRGNGATVDTLTIQKLQSLELRLPPLSEQQRIVGILEKAFEGIATAKANAEKSLQNARAIFESHLQFVFTVREGGWPTRQLGEVCDFEGGSQPPKSQFSYEPKHGYVRFLQIRDFKSDRHITFIPESKKNRLCIEDDIMIGRYGASVGKILTGKAGAYNVALMKTIPDLVHLDRSFFYHYLVSGAFQERLSNVAARSAQNGFSKEDIYGFPVPVPPLKEQQRVIEQIGPLSEETQYLARLYERKLAALEALKKSLLHQAFNGEL